LDWLFFPICSPAEIQEVQENKQVDLSTFSPANFGRKHQFSGQSMPSSFGGWKSAADDDDDGRWTMDDGRRTTDDG